MGKDIVCKMKLFYLILAGVCSVRARLEHMVRITNLEIPEGPLRYQDAPLNCQYEIGDNDTLYDVKWYKNTAQFFRCLGNGTVQEYPVDGIKLHHAGITTNGNCPVTIIAVTDEATDTYECEVSLDYPTYQNVKQSAMMRVIHYPRQNIYTTEIVQDTSSVVTPSSSIQYSPSTAAAVPGSSHRPRISIILVFIKVFFIYFYL